MDATGRRTRSRRDVLRVSGVGSLIALAGCTSDENDDESDDEDVAPEAIDVSKDATWRTASLEDVTTGEEISVADSDRPVIVHTFAIGCAVCESQHHEFGDLYANLGDELEIVDLTIDPRANPNELRDHADENGYDWRFGVSSEDVTESLVSDFGREVTTSADSPVIVDCPDGGTYRLEKVVGSGDLESVLEDVC